MGSDLVEELRTQTVRSCCVRGSVSHVLCGSIWGCELVGSASLSIWEVGDAYKALLGLLQEWMLIRA